MTPVTGRTAEVRVGWCGRVQHAMIRERQRDGIAKAKEAGKYRGRKSTMTVIQVQVIRDRAATGEK